MGSHLRTHKRVDKGYMLNFPPRMRRRGGVRNLIINSEEKGIKRGIGQKKSIVNFVSQKGSKEGLNTSHQFDHRRGGRGAETSPGLSKKKRKISDMSGHKQEGGGKGNCSSYNNANTNMGGRLGLIPVLGGRGLKEGGGDLECKARHRRKNAFSRPGPASPAHEGPGSHRTKRKT